MSVLWISALSVLIEQCYFLDLSTYGLQTPVKSPRKRLDVTPTKMPPARTPVKRPYFALSPTKTPTKSPVVSAIRLGESLTSPSKSIAVTGGVKLFTGGRLIARNQVFRGNLFGILRQRHKVRINVDCYVIFLTSLL